MSARLDDLRRQRALVQEHLAWLDREIAAEAARSAVPTALAAAPQASAAPAPAQPVFMPAAADPDALIERLARESDDTPTFSQTGCWTVFIVGLLLLVGAAVGALYFFYR